MKLIKTQIRILIKVLNKIQIYSKHKIMNK